MRTYQDCSFLKVLTIHPHYGVLYPSVLYIKKLTFFIVKWAPFLSKKTSRKKSVAMWKSEKANIKKLFFFKRPFFLWQQRPHFWFPFFSALNVLDNLIDWALNIDIVLECLWQKKNDNELTEMIYTAHFTPYLRLCMKSIEWIRSDNEEWIVSICVFLRIFMYQRQCQKIDSRTKAMLYRNNRQLH